MQNTLHSRLLLIALCFTALSPLTAQTPAHTVKILTKFVYPNSHRTSANGINDAGDVVGSFEVQHHFYAYERFSDGTMQSIIDQPQDDTEAYGVNDSGIVCGNTTSAAFFYDGSMFTFYDMATVIVGINNAGDFVGLVEQGNLPRGFASIGGNYITIDIPGAMFTIASGINNRDEIVGYYQDSRANIHGFYRDPAGNLTYPITVRKSKFTVLHGINDRGEIAGEWATRYANHGLVLRLPNHIISFDVPGSSSTSATGINNSGQISGSFNYRGTRGHGFIGQLEQ